MIDIMWQQPLKSQKKSNKNQDDKNGDKDGNEDLDKGATSFVEDKVDGAYRCFCCGDRNCRLYNCPKKDTLPPEKWFNPEYVKEYAKSMHTRQLHGPMMSEMKRMRSP